jgi:hypothetical protein
MKAFGIKRFQYKALAEIKEEIGGCQNVDDDEF